MIAGPYKSGSNDPDVHHANLVKMNRAALKVFSKGHIPVIGVNLALPMIECNEGREYEKLMMPISLGIAHKCDAILRIGGPSKGADQEVEVFELKGLPVYQTVEEIPMAD